MANLIPATQLSQQIEQLLTQRQEHVDAIAHIDELLAGVGSVLGATTPSLTVVSAVTGSVAGVMSSPAPAPKGRPAMPKAPKAKGAPRGPKPGRGRGQFAMSAEESILDYIANHVGATTQEINRFFKEQGRASTADNTLSKLTREKKIKRTPVKDGRGSTYSVA